MSTMSYISMYLNYIGYLVIGKPLLLVYESLKKTVLKYRLDRLIKKYGTLEATPDSKFPTITTTGLGDITFHHAMKEMALMTGVNLEKNPVGYVIWRCLSYNFAGPRELKEAMDLLRAKNTNGAVYNHFERYGAIPPYVFSNLSLERSQEVRDWLAGKTTTLYVAPPTDKEPEV